MIIPHNIEFKTPDLLDEYQQIHPKLRIVLEDMASFVVGHGYKFIVTDLLSELSEDKKLKRVSTSHLEGRGADVRCTDWPLEFREKLEHYYEAKYKTWAAISKETGKENLMLYHIGTALHLHIQLRKGL